MIALVFLSFLAGPALAECPLPVDAQALLECSLKNDPAVRLAAAKRLVAEAGGKQSRQRPNPELETKGTWGDGASQIEVDLVQTVETGGKRGARQERARAEQDAASAELLAAQAETAVHTVTALYRLRQVDSEVALIEEALETFSRVGEQLRSRPRLAPEQEVARSVFELAEADYILRRASLGAERTGLLRELETSAGVKLSTGPISLPQANQDWPEIPAAGALSGAEALRAHAALTAARAERGAARAASWPDVRLGPSFQRQSGEGSKQQMIGLNVGLALPLYHRNAAGRDQALRGEESAALNAESARLLLQTERDVERARYEGAVAALRLVGKRKDLHAKHETVEDFFQRGLISSSLVIEAHRQMYEFTRDRHELELAAVRALWRIRAIDGHVLGEKL